MLLVVSARPQFLRGIQTAFVGWLAVLFVCTPMICLRICELRHAMPRRTVPVLLEGMCGDFIAKLPEDVQTHRRLAPDAHAAPFNDNNADHSQAPLEAQRMLLGFVEFWVAVNVLCVIRRLLRFRLPPAPLQPGCAPKPPRMRPRFFQMRLIDATY
jgi:hypothetical protein